MMLPTMLPIVSEWFACYDQNELQVTILTPNGLMINMIVNREARLFEIKEDVFEMAQDLPMYGALYDKQTYVFTCVNFTTGEQEELDEDRRIVDIKPFMQILRLVGRKGNIASKQLNAQIGPLIGKGLHEFDALKNPEINDFRWRARIRCEEIQEERNNRSWIDKVNYKYPFRIEKSKELPLYLKNHLVRDDIEIEVRFSTFKLAQLVTIPYRSRIEEVLRITMELFQHTPEESEEYALKVCGQEEFLMGNHELIQYKYVMEAIANSTKPSFIIIPTNEISVNETPKTTKNEEFRQRSSTMMSFQGTTRRKAKPISSFSIEDKLTIIVNDCIKVNHSDDARIAVQAGLFHGGIQLAHCTSSPDENVINGSCSWNEPLTFDISICDIPRMARLCFVVYEIMVRARKGSRGKFFRANINCEITLNPLKWANTPVFDYRGQLKTGSLTLPMWNYLERCEPDDMFNPLGTVVPNPHADDATCLTITFPKYHDSSGPGSSDPIIFYPSLETILGLKTGNEVRKSGDHTPSSRYLEQLKNICRRDPLTEMAEKDKELLWYFREDCCMYLPNSLPHLLNCVQWNNHHAIIEMLRLLNRWPPLEPEKSLELLDYAYADCHVRSFALKCLSTISDDDLSLYLLQLVQALKYESYLYCDLALFLLERALNNRTIGHHLFWLLRSEMAEPSVSVYFGLILEAYCRGAIDHMKDLSKQMEAVNKLRHMNEIVKRESTARKESKERLMSIMHEILDQSYYKDSLKDVTNPLNPRIKLKTIRVERCKLMDSKMKPLWLVFGNSDSDAEDVSIIFKNGDDLRQDMLTLQMFRIMDKLWKDEGLDLRMTPYRVIATDRLVGLIEVVLSTQTLAKIQKSNSMKATSAFNKASLLNWLRIHNPEDDQLARAIEQFTLSCAGYCVATYVLGIADRHSDNILVKSNGQILHIDFGHILGKFKEKFGIRRERVPFVLTNDFVYVITSGNTRRGDFARFQSHCEQAFTILRKRGPFILSLFAMMLSTGIPELSSIKDLDYLRETLVLDLSDEEALQHFRSKFDEALKNSWKTNINWLAHNIAKDNN